MVIIDTAIALASLCHKLTIIPRIPHFWHLGLPLITPRATESLGFLLAGAEDEEDSASYRSRTHNTNHHTSRDCSFVGTVVLGFLFGGFNVGFLGDCGNNDCLSTRLGGDMGSCFVGFGRAAGRRRRRCR